MNRTPSQLLTELLEQHQKLREIMDRCERLADGVDNGGGDPAALTREVARLRVAFDAHNQFEEHLLPPVLRELDAFGDVRIDRMFENHVHEHRSIRRSLESPQTLRSSIHDLRVHLEAEERYFLSSKVLRDDLITLESGG